MKPERAPAGKPARRTVSHAMAVLAVFMAVFPFARVSGAEWGREDPEGLHGNEEGREPLAGASLSHGVLFMKADADGNRQWVRTAEERVMNPGAPDFTPGGEGASGAAFRQETRDGGVILTGCAADEEGECDVLLAKKDERGELEWTAAFGGDGTDAGYAVAQTADGGYVIAGFTESHGNGGRDAWLIRTDPEGTGQWDVTYGEKADEAAVRVYETDDGGFLVEMTSTTSREVSYTGTSTKTGPGSWVHNGTCTCNTSARAETGPVDRRMFLASILSYLFLLSMPAGFIRLLKWVCRENERKRNAPAERKATFPSHE